MFDHTIMIVEDHAAVRGCLRHWLQDAFPQYHVLEAATGEDALAQAATHHPGVVLMDLDLPGMGGLEVIRRLKADAPDTKVVVLTAHEGTEYRRRAAAAGACAYATKTRIGSEFIPVMRTLLTSPAAVAEGSLSAKPSGRRGAATTAAVQAVAAARVDKPVSDGPEGIHPEGFILKEVTRPPDKRVSAVA